MTRGERRKTGFNELGGLLRGLRQQRFTGLGKRVAFREGHEVYIVHVGNIAMPRQHFATKSAVVLEHGLPALVWDLSAKEILRIK